MNTLVVRRLYFYVAAFIGLQVLAAGLRMVIAVLLERIFWPGAITSANFDVTQLSFSIALLVVGLPLWAIHWYVIQRGQARAEEQQSVLRRLYGYAVLLVAMLSLLFAGQSFLQWLLEPALDSSVTPAGSLAALVVSGVIWVYHWRVFSRDRVPVEVSGGTATLRRWYLVIVQAFSLGVASYGAFDLLQYLLRLAFATEIGASDGARYALPGLIAGLVVWLPHHLWGRQLLDEGTPLHTDEVRSTLRQVYNALVVTAAAVVALGGLVSLLAAALLALFGGSTWSSVYQEQTAAIAAVLVALPLWRYHRALLTSEARLSLVAARGETARRLVGYLTAAIGLGTLFFGLGGLLGDLLRLLFASTAIGSDWRDPISRDLALSIIALPVFATAARAMQRLAGESPIEERALARRIYLYGALLFGIITLIVALVSVVRIAIAAVLGEAQPDVLPELGRWLGYAVIGVAIAAYHLNLLRGVSRSGDAGAGHTIAIVAEEHLRTLLSTALAHEFPGLTLHAVDLQDAAGVAGALTDAQILIVSLAAVADGTIASVLQPFQGRRLLLATGVPGYEVVGVRGDDEALTREAVRRVQDEISIVQQAVPSPAPTLAAG